jgi:hypothetical protein
MVLGLWQVFMPTAGTEEESNGSLAEEDALITGQVPEGAASEARA